MNKKTKYIYTKDYYGLENIFCINKKTKNRFYYNGIYFISNKINLVYENIPNVTRPLNKYDYILFKEYNSFEELIQDYPQVLLT